MDRAGMLAGTRVLDVSTWRPGPYCTQLLAEWGADVLRVERPGGDPMRVFPDMYRMLNRRKRVCELNLKAPAGRDSVLELVRDAHVFVEGFRPGVADRLGLGPDALRHRSPALVYCSISGFGRSGPLSQVAGHDLNYQAWAGTVTSQERPALPVADLAAGLFAAAAICAALVSCASTGRGETIDVSMADVLASWSVPTAGGSLSAVNRQGTAFPGYATYVCADGLLLTLGVVAEDHFWRALCGVLGLDDAAHLTASERAASGEDLRARVAAAVGTRNRAGLLEELLDAGVPAAPVQDRAAVLSTAHFLHRGTVGIAADGTPAVGHPLHYDEHPAPAATDEGAAGRAGSALVVKLGHRFDGGRAG